MAYKNIVAVLTGSDGDVATLAEAFAAARLFEAHVQALFVIPNPDEAVPFVGMPISTEVVQQIIDSAVEVAEAARTHAHDNFTAAADKAHATIQEHARPGAGVRCTFQEVSGRFVSKVQEAARFADLVVFGSQPVEGGPDVGSAFVETLTRSGRPVLLAPKAPVTDLTRKVVIGWDGGVAAAHALSAALPFLAQATDVELYSVSAPPRDSSLLDEPVGYLALHGVTAKTRIIDPQGAAPGVVLLSEAERAGATMLVLGGYGHSRLMETLFGGATVHISARATLPLFMMH